jgi:hypothetical protein
MNYCTSIRRAVCAGLPGISALISGLFFTQSLHAETAAGTALSFDGVNDYVTVSNSAALNVYPLTIMTWFQGGDFRGCPAAAPSCHSGRPHSTRIAGADGRVLGEVNLARQNFIMIADWK